MEIQQEKGMRAHSAPRRRVNKKVLGAALLAAMLVLIFFSRTIYAHNLPMVTAAMPKSGRLTNQEIVSGAADWRDRETLYMELSGIVEEVLAKEGDSVKKGQPLLRMKYDLEEIEKKLEELEQSRARLKLDLKELSLRREKTERYMQTLREENYELPEQTDYELRQLELELASARRALEDAIREYHTPEWDEEGNAIYKDSSKIDSAQASLTKLELQKEELLRKQRQQAEDAVKELAEKEKKREESLKDYQAELDSGSISLQSKKLEQQALDAQEEALKRQLEEFEQYREITSPVDGTLLTLSAEKGESIQANHKLAVFGVGTAFTVECTLPKDNGFVAQGDACRLQNAMHQLEGTVKKLEVEDNVKKVTVEVESDTLSAGESLEIQFKKEGDTRYTLVPNGAINKDNDGYFLYQIKRREGVLGEEYYVDRLAVTIGASDAEFTAVIQGIGFMEPIVLLSDKGLSRGVTVTVENEEEFFDDA